MNEKHFAEDVIYERFLLRYFLNIKDLYDRMTFTFHKNVMFQVRNSFDKYIHQIKLAKR